METEPRSPYVWMRDVLSGRDLEEVQELAFACPHQSDWQNYPQAAGRAVGRSIELTEGIVAEQMETVRRRFPTMFNEWTQPYSFEPSGNRCLREQAGDDTSKIPYAVHSDGEQRHLVAILYIGQWEGGATRMGSEEEHEEFLRVKGPEQLMGGGEISGIAPRGFELNVHKVPVCENSILVFHQERVHCVDPVTEGARISIHMRITPDWSASEADNGLRITPREPEDLSSAG